MTDNFDKVKRGVPIGAVIGHYGGEIVRRFVNPSLCCGHNDCFSVSEDDGVFKCHSCGAKGSIIDLVMKMDGLTDVEAMKRCAEIGNVEIEETAPRRPAKEKAEGGQAKALRLALEYYEKVRANGAGEDAEKWFISTRGHAPETMTALRMGWTDGKLTKHLREAHGFTTSDLVKYGLAVDRDKEGVELKDPRDFFWKAGMAVFPVIDHEGKVVNLTVKDPAKEFKGQQLPGIEKDWFLNHEALGRYEEIIVVEGQNDKASLFDLDMKNVIGTCGAPSEKQVKSLRNHCAGKTVFLWFDKDPGRDPKKDEGGPRFTRFIYQRLREDNIDVRVIVHPGETKDPDDFIQGEIKRGKAPARKVVRKLLEEALTPLEWEISEIDRIEGAKDSLAVVRKRDLLKEISRVEFAADRNLLIDALAKAIPMKVSSIEELIESAQELHREIGSAFRDIKKAQALDIADFIFKWFLKNGGNWFKTKQDGKSWLHYRGHTYEIGNNNEFNAIMYRMARLGRCEAPGTQVWYYLETQCADQGEAVDMMSWVYTCRETDTLYINLNLPHQKILKIEPGKEPVVIENGTNENSVLLSTSPQIRDFVYKPDTSEAEGLSALKTLLMDSTPCEPHQRYFLICWMISRFMINYQSDRGLLQVIGESGLGKSKVAERDSQLFYGENYVGSGTGAADARIATRNPIVYFDNTENRDLNQGRVNFMLLLANSARKPKAASGSDTEVVYQKLDAFGMVTAIEPFPGKLPELINRTFPLILEKQYQIKGYNHDETMRGIFHDRPTILSAILKMLGKGVLPRLSERSFWSQHINSVYPGHNKERNNEHLCTMLIILEALLHYLPFDSSKDPRKQATTLLEKWINYQDEQASQTEINSNTLLTIMDALQKEICISLRKNDTIKLEEIAEFKGNYYVFEDPEYLETFYLSESLDANDVDKELALEYDRVQYFEVMLSSAELSTLLDRFCKNLHKRNPFENPTALGARIANDRKVMEKGGWQYVEHPKHAPRWKKTKGIYYWRFRKVIKAIKG